jgi:hypothetical protein
MVRAVELNCRNGWAADLWEPMPEGATLLASEHHPASHVPDLPEIPEPVATSAEAQDVGPGRSDGVDLVVYESPLLHQSTTGAAASSGADARPEDRDLILRARDIQRIRQANRTRPTLAPLAADEPDRTSLPLGEPPTAQTPRPASTESRLDPGTTEGAKPTASFGSVETVDEDRDAIAEREAIEARFAVIGPVPPVPSSELRTDLLGMGASRAEAEFRFDTVPEVDPTFSLPFRERANTAPLRAGFNDDRAGEAPPIVERIPEPDVVGSVSTGATEEARFVLDVPPAFTEPVINDDRANDEPVPRRWSRGRGERERPVVPEPAAEGRAGRWQAARARRRDREHQIGDPMPDRTRIEIDVPPPVELPEARAEAIEITDDGARSLPEPRVRDERRAPIAEPVGIALVDDPSYLPGVFRCCRTCRDFRPAEGGERGWCNNSWAFQHRRMVHGDEMPCWGAVGSWWVPRDEVWLDDLDVDHGHGTPLVDAMLARRAAASAPPPERLRRRGRP